MRTRIEEVWTARGIPVSFECWFEDGVWNATAIGFAVAIFSDTHDHAVDLFRLAVSEHIEILAKQDERSMGD